MQVEILNADSDGLRWRQVLSGLPTDQQDIYSSAEYHRVCEVNGEGKGRAFLAQKGGDVLFHPFLLRPIDRVGQESVSGSWSDIETVYGYGGPLATTTAPAFISKAWKAFADWCEEQRVVAEFIRFNPFLENHKYVEANCRVELDRETVAVRLDRSEEELWMDYPSGQRSKVRKAVREGLTGENVPLERGLEQFKSLYRETMDSLEADAYYYFSDEYFHQISSTMASNAELFQVKDVTEVVAMGLFLTHGNRIHYHLGASKRGSRDSRPNNLLFHTVADWGRQRGFRYMHLGGGNNQRNDDPLFRFKASISRSRLAFFLGSRISNREAYDDLCARWMAQTERKQRPNYFLMYRLP